MALQALCSVTSVVSAQHSRGQRPRDALPTGRSKFSRVENPQMLIFKPLPAPCWTSSGSPCRQGPRWPGSEGLPPQDAWRGSLSGPAEPTEPHRPPAGLRNCLRVPEDRLSLEQEPGRGRESAHGRGERQAGGSTRQRPAQANLDRESAFSPASLGRLGGRLRATRRLGRPGRGQAEASRGEGNEVSATPLPDLSHGAQVIRFGGVIFISARFHAMEFNYEFDCFFVHNIKSFTF